ESGPCSVAMVLRPSTSHSFTPRGSAVAARYLPSGLKARHADEEAPAPRNVAVLRRRATSHSRMVQSPLNVAGGLPSGLNAREATQRLCPRSVACGFNVAASHRLSSADAVPPLPVTSVLPSGLKATAWASAFNPFGVGLFLPVRTSHIWTSLQ